MRRRAGVGRREEPEPSAVAVEAADRPPTGAAAPPEAVPLAAPAEAVPAPPEAVAVPLAALPVATAVLHPDGRLVAANPAAGELLRRPVESLLGATLDDLTHPDDRRPGCDLVEATSGGQRQHRRCLAPDGTVVPVELAVAPLDTDRADGPLLLCQLLDAVERKRQELAQHEVLERERDLVAALQELDRAKSVFVSTVSHELRTPLTNTLGYLELLADGAAGELSEPQAAMVTIVERNSKRLLRLVEDLLALSQADAGRLRAGTADVDVADLVASAVASHAAAAEQGGVTVEIAVDADCGRVVGDRSRLARALSHVFGNGVKFTKAGGSVTLRAWRPPADPPTVVLEVRDTGIGIPEAEQSQLFTRFFRSSTAYDEAVQGSGLGLALARELVEAHDGSVAVTSREGHGTTVSITLPACPAGGDGSVGPTSAPDREGRQP